ncbi:interferon-induced protein with tetratricopeptide repeats 5 isoform X1 [Fundulus heteroclitus]|uniref:interferon-induced protein with tetratricopeptide repeats 5 isoform X1 n=2 Tax=Fundulus heteroclitus TaxID=8078 RepID=UPI00165C8259|nr:interferon-induced protein with tetratricopeptide repeats 5 isoform X1 [Fundulus heteroclitus]
MSDSSGSSALCSMLQQLQSRFTWNLRKEDMDMESLSTRLKEHIKLQLGRPGAVALSYSFLAYVRYLQNQPEEALSLLLQSEQKTKECYGEESERRLIVTYGDLAWLKYHTGYYLESQTYCQRVQDILKKYPSSSSTVLHPEVYGEQGWTYLKFSKSLYPKAIECFLSALEIQKDDSEWNAGYAIALFRTERNKPEPSEKPEDSAAIKQLHQALEINPDDAVLLSMLSVKLGAYKKHEEAESLVEKALKTDPENPHVLRYIAKYLRNQGENDRSIDLLERALKRTSQSAFIHHQLGLCYKKKKIAEQSSKPYKKQMVQQLRHQCIQNLEKAVKIKPSFALARADLALMYGEDKDFDRAEEMFQHCFKMFPEIPDESVCQVIHQRYAEFHFYHTKKPADAIDHYKKGLQLTPKTWEWIQCIKKLKKIADDRLSEDEDDSLAYALLAQVAKAEGDMEKAAEMFEKALDCDENNSEYLSALCELRMNLH